MGFQCFIDVRQSPWLAILLLDVLELLDTHFQVSCLWNWIELPKSLGSSNQSLSHASGMLTKKICVVSSFLYNQHIVANVNEAFSHVGVLNGGQLTPAQKVVESTVKSTGDNDEIWLKFSYHWKQHKVANNFVLCIPQVRLSVVLAILLIHNQTCLPRDIDVEVLTFSGSDVGGLHALVVWVESQIVATVQRDEQHLVVVVEVFLRAVSVVDVPVKDAHSFLLLKG